MLACVIALTACGDGDGGDDDDDPATIPYDTLAEYGLFEGDGSAQMPAPGVVPYDVIAPLYSDRTVKHRFIRVPDSATIGWSDDGDWGFPNGTILVKTFAFPVDARDPQSGERLLETRLLIRGDDGVWTAHTYLWNDEQTEATRLVAGKRLPVTWIDETGATIAIEYRVPNTNQCQNCHGEAPGLHALGPRTRQLNMARDYGGGPVNQIDHLASLGLFDSAPPPVAERRTLDDYRDDTLDAERRARSYLEANCAHCHNIGSPAESSGLILSIDETEAKNLGVCRVPFSAGDGTGDRPYDVYPGDPEQSVMIFRVESTEPEIKMPELPTVTSDPQGVAILRAWIAGMSPAGCM